MSHSLPKTCIHGLLFANALLYLSLPPCCTGLDDLLATNATTSEGGAPLQQGGPVGIILPPGCSCRDGGVHPSQCSSFDCGCPCDVTRGSCDWNCCCDGECHVDERSRFTECVDEDDASSSRDAMQFCYQADEALEKINPKYPLRIDDSAEDALNGLICVVDDNSQVKGNFYKNPGFPDADAAFATNGPGRKRYDYNSHLADDAGTTTAAARPNGSYELGDVIPTIQKTSKWGEPYVGLLRLPSPGDGGLCTVLNAVEFGVDVVDSGCIQIVSDISLQCEESFLNVDDFVTTLSVGKEDDVGVSVNEDDFEKAEWGAYVDEDGNEMSPDINTTHWDGSAMVCFNALKSLRYDISHDRNGSIARVSARVETTNIGVSDHAIRQTYSVRFSPTEETDDVEGDGEGSNGIVLTKKSGNPGYIMGSPTLAAKLVSQEDDYTYVDAEQEGLTIMDTGLAGFCSVTTTGRTEVGFGEDKFVGCMLRLTRSELRDLCTSKTSPLLSNVTLGSGTMYFPAWLKIEQHLVGIFGNADPLDRNQWVRLESPLDSPDRAIKERVWLPTTNVCEGLATRLTYRILWTHVGNVNSPQAKIISAQVDFDHSTPLKHTSGPTEGQIFPLITTVTWSYLAPESSTPVKPPPPTLLFSVPEDVFYPFDVGASSALTAPVSGILSFVILGLCLSIQ